MGVAVVRPCLGLPPGLAKDVHLWSAKEQTTHVWNIVSYPEVQEKRGGWGLHYLLLLCLAWTLTAGTRHECKVKMDGPGGGATVFFEVRHAMLFYTLLFYTLLFERQLFTTANALYSSVP